MSLKMIGKQNKTKKRFSRFYPEKPFCFSIIVLIGGISLPYNYFTSLFSLPPTCEHLRMLPSME